MRSHSTFAAIALALLTTPASAAVIAFDYTATVTATDGAVVPLGQEIHGRFAYDDDPSACIPTGAESVLVLWCLVGPEYRTGGGPIGPDWSVSIIASNQAVVLTSSQVFMNLQVGLGRDDEEYGHGSDFFMFAISPPTSTGPSGEFRLFLSDANGSALMQQDGTMPTFPAPGDVTRLAAWDFAAEISSTGGFGFGNFTAQITSLSQAVIPEPATGLLLTTGLLGLAGWRRRSV